MSLTTIAVNGVPVEDYGVEPIRYERWLAPPARRYSAVSLVGRVGAAPSTRGSSYEPRALVLGVRPTTATATSLMAGRDALGAWYAACQGLLEIESIDRPGRVCYGLFEGAEDSPFGLTLVSPQVDAVGRITCYDPLWYDRQPTVVGVAEDTRLTVPVGTAPGRYRFAIVGAATAPTVTLRTRAGAVIETMRFDQDSFALASTDVLTVDWLASSPVQKVSSGVASDVFDALNPDDSFLEIDPDDGPTLEVDDGSLILTAWRGWLA